jgi:uncharacterized protein (TIGR02001 family)
MVSRTGRTVLPTLLRAVALAVGILMPAAASAQEAGPWTLEGTFGAVTDYRFRGLSLSDERPAVQAGATLSHASGFYGDVYLSSIEEYGLDADGDGATIEATLTAGWAGAWLGLDWDAAVSAYRYPRGTDVDYVEIPVQAGRTVGATTWAVGAAYAPAQDALGDEDNRYLWAGVEHAPEGWPVSLAASVGHEAGAWAPDGKTDWRLGAFRALGPAVLGAEWIDSDVDSDADGGALVVSLFFAL